MVLNSKTDKKSKETWIHRFAIWLFTLVLTVLAFWVLGFFVDDIRSIRGPDYATIEKKFVDKNLVAKQTALAEQIADLTRRIDNQTEKQHIVGDSSLNLQQTINQLLELRKQGIEKGIAFSHAEQVNFTNSLNLFLDNQRKYQ